MDSATNATLAITSATFLNATLELPPAILSTNNAGALFSLAELALWALGAAWGWLKLKFFYLVGIFVYYQIVRHFLLDLRYIPSRSMSPTFEIDDPVLVDKITYYFARPQINDIVLFRPPEFLEQDPDGVFVKRLVAQAGDVVQVLEGRLVVNGFAQDEYYAAEPRSVDMRPVLVPEDHVFVMGDNRNLSFDSTHWGPLPTSNIVGRSVTSFWLPRSIRNLIFARKRPLARRRSFEFLPCSSSAVP